VGKDSDEPAAPRRRRVSVEPPVNAIQATRKPRRIRSAVETAPSRPGPSDGQRDTAATRPGGLARGDSDPWTVPESVRDRFVQDGHRFYFPDGAPAFKDQGRRLTTASENTQVVHSLIEIAHLRGWTEVTVTGTERFRQEAWRQARMAGLNVRGHRPTEPEQAQLIRALARGRSVPLGGAADAISAETQPSESQTPMGTSGAPRAASDAQKGRIAGKLLDHGRDAYRHDPHEEPSYFVRVETRDGKREIWGKDLERAMTQSLTQPQVGDAVILQKTGRDVVTVKRAERDSAGHLKPKEIETHRNRWVIEKSTFFDERAQAAHVVRDATIDARTAVRDHPELTGTYLNLKAAALASRALRDPQDQKRFVAQVRAALADGIERGEPLQPVRLRERVAHVGGRPAREAERGSAR
jgi:hypothetical protein